MGLRQVLSVPGRCFPVEVVHSLEDHSRDYLQAAIDTAIDIHVEQPEGDVCLSTRGDTHCMAICRTGACTSITGPHPAPCGKLSGSSRFPHDCRRHPDVPDGAVGD